MRCKTSASFNHVSGYTSFIQSEHSCQYPSYFDLHLGHIFIGLPHHNIFCLTNPIYQFQSCDSFFYVFSHSTTNQSLFLQQNNKDTSDTKTTPLVFSHHAFDLLYSLLNSVNLCLHIGYLFYQILIF